MPPSKITIVNLIETGIIQPGVSVLTITHKNKLRATADLNDDGTITWATQKCISLNKFGHTVMGRPTNAWLAVFYNGFPLSNYRDQYEPIPSRVHPFIIPESWSDDDWYGSTREGLEDALDIIGAHLFVHASDGSESNFKYVYGVMNRLIEESKM